jgi:hypothetical protein
MNTKLFASALIAAVGFAAAPSFAGDYMTGEVGYVPPAPVASYSGVTRAAVQNEYLQARRNDALNDTGEGADVGAVASAKSTLSRDAVRAEAVYAVRHGLTIGGEV